MTIKSPDPLRGPGPDTWRNPAGLHGWPDHGASRAILITTIAMAIIMDYWNFDGQLAPGRVGSANWILRVDNGIRYLGFN